LHVPDYGSPITLIIGPAVTEQDIGTAAALCVRYSDARALETVSVTVSDSGRHYTLQVRPADAAMIDSLLIEKKKTQTSAILY
ncbi:MAG: hypothetical protein WA610_13695, partial [Thermodesulfovibrionales bacterium]